MAQQSCQRVIRWYFQCLRRLLVHRINEWYGIWMFPKIVVPPNHPTLIGFSIINHPFWGIPIFGNTHIYLHLANCLIVTVLYIYRYTIHGFYRKRGVPCLIWTWGDVRQSVAYRKSYASRDDEGVVHFLCLKLLILHECPPKPPTFWDSYTRTFILNHETLRNDRGGTKNDDFWYTCLPDFITHIKTSGTMRDTHKTMTISATSGLADVYNRSSLLLTWLREVLILATVDASQIWPNSESPSFFLEKSGFLWILIGTSTFGTCETLIRKTRTTTYWVPVPQFIFFRSYPPSMYVKGDSNQLTLPFSTTQKNSEKWCLRNYFCWWEKSGEFSHLGCIKP